MTLRTSPVAPDDLYQLGARDMAQPAGRKLGYLPGTGSQSSAHTGPPVNSITLECSVAMVANNWRVWFCWGSLMVGWKEKGRETRGRGR